MWSAGVFHLSIIPTERPGRSVFVSFYRRRVEVPLVRVEVPLPDAPLVRVEVPLVRVEVLLLPDAPLVRVEVPLVRVEVPLVRVEEAPERAGAAEVFGFDELSRLTVVVLPCASVVLIVVRVVPLLLTLVLTVVDGTEAAVLEPDDLSEPDVLTDEPELLSVLLPDEADEEAALPEPVVRDEEAPVVRTEELVDDEDDVLLVLLSAEAACRACVLWVSVRSWPALRIVTPEPFLVSVCVTRCSNESLGCSFW